MNEKRKRLLIELEKIVGNEFYNAKIQNWVRAESSKAKEGRFATR